MGMDDALAQIINGSFDKEKAQAISNAVEALEATFKSNDMALIEGSNEKLLALDPTNSTGLNVGMRLAQINDDREAFQALFKLVPSAELNGSQAARLLDNLLSFDNPSWVEPQLVHDLMTRSTGEDASTGSFLTAAKAAHFLGDIEAAIAFAKQAVEGKEDAAADFVALYENISNLE